MFSFIPKIFGFNEISNDNLAIKKEKSKYQR